MLFQNICEVQTFVSQNNSEKNKTTLEAFHHLVQGIAYITLQKLGQFSSAARTDTQDKETVDSRARCKFRCSIDV